jgi:hypothetical protein
VYWLMLFRVIFWYLHYIYDSSFCILRPLLGNAFLFDVNIFR